MWRIDLLCIFSRSILLYFVADCLFKDLFLAFVSRVNQALIDEVYSQREGISCNGDTSSSLPCFWSPSRRHLILLNTSLLLYSPTK